MTTTFTVSSLANVSYLPGDMTAYTATSTCGQRFSITYPAGTPASYPDVYGSGVNAQTPWKWMLIQQLSGGSPGTTSAAPSSSFSSANGFPDDVLLRGIAIVEAQLTSFASGNTQVKGFGAIHLPGSVDNYYESRASHSAIRDAVFIIQHIRFNAAAYPVTSASSYKLGDWFAYYGAQSAFGLPWCAASPSRACELGSGGPYDMSTVPNFVVANSVYPFNWFKFKNDESNTGGYWPATETGTTSYDGTGAASLAAAPQRLINGIGVYQLLSDLGEPCHPKAICFTNTGPEDLNFGEPHTENLRKFATGVHDGWHYLCLRQAQPAGRIDVRLSPAAQFTLNELQTSNIAIPTAYYDGQLSVAATGHVASTGSISLAAGQPSDGDTVTISDGFNQYTFEFDNNASVTAGNQTVTIGGSNVVSLSRLLQKIASLNMQLTAVLDGPATTAAMTSSATDIAANPTWAKSGANITIAGLTGGVQSTQGFTAEDEISGVAIRALVEAAQDSIPRWDDTLPPAGICRRSQVNVIGRCIVPPAWTNGPGSKMNGRTGVKLLCTSLSCDGDLYWGHSAKRMRNRLRPGEQVWVPGTDRIWAKSEAAGTQVAKYEARECDERSK